jgi:hypothetical protein
MKYWISLITSLPTENATVRMRAWRSLKTCGAAVLRDGVYLMPEQESYRDTLESIAADVRLAGGTALVLRIEEPDEANFIDLFNRSDDYITLLADVAKVRDHLLSDTQLDILKQTRKLRKLFASIADIDFFAGEAQRQAEVSLQELEALAARTLSPDEPYPVQGVVTTRSISHYQARIWATRRRPWVDRLASAWLIRRFIDKDARLLWLESANDCPADAIGFDFDGATFSHINGRVTFEVLLASFGLETPALNRIGALVHYLDVGGIQPTEASGIESVLTGLREAITDDDQLLATASSVFDGLLANFQKEGT